MRLICLLLYFNCLVAVATSSQESFCPASIHSPGARITQVDLALRSKHVKKRLQGQSQMSCSQRCLQQDWCISVNYEVSRPEGGACELNTFGVEMMADANPKNPEFKRKKGWIYSQLRSAQFTLSLQACKDGSFTCSNGGTCEVDCKTLVPRCHCPEGFSGDKCEDDINECQSNPCKNGGTCANGENKYSCVCAPGFTGTNCDTDIDDCAGDPCANGGTCTDGINGFTCTCPAGYTGNTCGTDIDECASSPCQNGATCNDGVNNYTCSCIPGFTGTRCETNIDECASSPCQNGATCNDGVNNYTCSCIPGFTGTNCETNIDDCPSGACNNGGTCIDGLNSYTCKCVTGFTGASCDTETHCEIVFPVGNKSGFPVVTFSSPGVVLEQFAVCAWYSLYQKWTENVILSYVTSDNTSQLEVTIKRDGKIGLSVNWKSVAVPLRDKFLNFEGWHFFCIGFQGNSVRFTSDSEEFGTEDFDLLSNEKLTGGGKLVLGAAQRCFGGCFQESSMFKGNLTNVNIFNKRDTTTYYHCKTDAMTYSDTRILTWRTIQRGHPSNGTISATCPASCKPNTVQDPWCEFQFPNRSRENYVAVPVPGDLSACTICAWYSLSSEWKDNVILSYVTSDNTSQFQVVIKADGRLELMVNWKTFIIPKAKGGLLYLSGWHPFCVQWRDGKVGLYRQDTDFGEETYNDLEGQLVGSGGKLIIGAAQRCYGGCFQESLTFRGNLSQVNIWTNVLGGSEVDKVISSCGGYSDTPAALNWKTIQVPPLNGGVLISCEGGCQSGPAEEKSCDLVFSTRSPSNFASLTIQDDLVEFTICAWYSLASNATDNVILSYVTQDNSSQFQIKIKQDGKIEVMINWKAIHLGPILNDDRIRIASSVPLIGWHHFCVFWRTSGETTVYCDNNKVLKNSFAALTTPINGGGKVVIGQSQGCYLGCFNDTLAFQGRLTQVNIWHTAFDSSDFSNVFNAKGKVCHSVTRPYALIWGSVLASPLNGDVYRSCPSSC
ncbi:uncharacterized protein LOC5505993 [Nematostella vectensis]|uniref:uncharacterized protein LOC5505993 n=1 Tax=Nematostella vectensis TaxID=45351 RepID=UPI0020775F7E|nr:uncharacterized protein LOC5505993 [Nematostella vectensis]